MATVYLCTDLKFDRKVAIKLLHPDLAAAVGADRFHREIKIATGLTHPNILPAHDSGEADGSLFYVMPFVDGESLRDRLTRERQLPVQSAVQITTEVGSALQYAHSQGIIHRDIKPENILIESQHAVLADFGIARAITSAADVEALTQTGMSLGTPAYMSPEQAMGERHLDGRSDQYSLACVLYEMLAGYPPFQANTMQALVAKHLGEPVALLTTVRPAVPDELEDVVLRALEKVPADRFASMQEFTDALNSTIAVTGTWARRTGRVTPIRTTRNNRIIPQTPQPPARRWLWPAVAAGIVVLGGGIAAWRWTGARGGADIRQMGAAAFGLEDRRIAVTYFSDLSADKTLRDVATGLTEGLIDNLTQSTQLRELEVVSKSGIAKYRDSTIASERLARAFKAAWLVTGNVARDGGDIVVTLSLIDGGTGRELDTKRFRAGAGRALALRDSIMQQVAAQLKQKVGVTIAQSEQRLEAHNDDAWLLVQQADRLRRDAEEAIADRNLAAGLASYVQADSLLARAQQLDAKWPEPTIQRSNITARRARSTAVPAERLALLRQSVAYAQQVIDNNPQSPQIASAYESRGFARYLMYYLHLIPDQREADAMSASAIQDLEQATKLAPRSSSAWMALSSMYANKPAFAESKLAATNAYQSDPFGLNAANILDRLYKTSYITETFNDADIWCTTGHARFPADPRFVECALWTYTIQEIRPRPSIDTVWMLADSIQKVAPPAKREYMRREAHIVAGIVLGILNQPDSARRVLDRVLETPKEVDPDNELMSYNAYARLTLGDKRKAIDILKTYLTRNPEHRAGWGKDSAWWWRELKKDPEFQRLIATGT